MWIALVSLFSLIKGVKMVIKKMALQNISVIEFLFSLLVMSLVLMLPACGEAVKIEPQFYGLIGIRALLVLIHEILSAIAIKKMTLGTYGILDLSRILFTTLLTVTILKETVGELYIIGLIIVCIGLVIPMFDRSNGKEEGQTDRKLMILAIFSASLISSAIDIYDKMLMKGVTSVQVQFWYLVYLVIVYGIYILITKTKIRLEVFKNKYMWLMAVLTVVSGQALLSANEIPQSNVAVMAVIKESGCLVSILAGKYIFKEKNMLLKIVSVVIVMIGIIVCVI